jgi:Domain of unknown function (DUF4091)
MRAVKPLGVSIEGRILLHRSSPFRGIEQLTRADDAASVRPLRLLVLALLLALLPLALQGPAQDSWAAAAAASVAAYPSSSSIPPAGPISGGRAAIVLNTGIGEREGAWIVVRGANQVARSLAVEGLASIGVEVDWAHFVSFDGKLVPDALLPWDGAQRPAERPNQPLYVRVTVPRDARPGTYRGHVAVHADGRTVTVPLTVKVFPVRLPPPGVARGNMLTSFHISPEAYVNAVGALYGFGSNEQRRAANHALFSWLAGYRISPASWGFGEPKSRAGYEASDRWWVDSAGNMTQQLEPGRFAALRIPISNNRQRRPIAGVSPTAPETWCPYLRSVHAFWSSHGWLAGTVPYVYAVDEPGAAGQKLVARQAAATHACFPGGRQLMTGRPSANNRYLWDGRGRDDLDIWVVLLRRWYGRFTSPARQVTANRARENLRYLDAVRRRGKMVWSYLYTGVPGTPGFRAVEPLSNPRMYLLWNALEGTDGILYGQGTTNFKASASPLERVERGGEFVLLYPGRAAPIPSARLEQIRDGLEDAALFDIVRRTRGAAAVRRILGGSGLFSANARGVELACSVGCALERPHAYAWPVWSHDASTPGRIEDAKAKVLKQAAGSGGAGR